MMNLEMVMSLMLRSPCPKPYSHIPSMVSLLMIYGDVSMLKGLRRGVCRFLEVGFAFLGTSAQNMALGPSQKRFNLTKWALRRRGSI
jgi:hypothetical protein